MDTFGLHHATPSLAVIDPRGLAVRGVAYWRGEVGQAPAARLTRQVFDAVARPVEQWDARLPAPALSQCFSLSGRVSGNDSVDAGWHVLLFGQADDVRARWDGRGSRAEIEYDSSLRVQAVTEQAKAEAARVVERFEYGTVEMSAGNQCGRLIRHDDPAGTRYMTEYDLLGLARSEISHFLKSLDPPDWPLDPAARDDWLEAEPGLASRWAYSPLGDLLSLTDARGHRRQFGYSVAGQLTQGWLKPMGATERCLVRDIRYNPSGKVERETAGNGVITQAEYALSDGRLERLNAGLPNAEPLQDLRYSVDPVGNIVQIDDQALPIRYFKNQRIDPLRTYTYDTVGQLVSATGWEAADAGAVLNYREEYEYDAGGNMTELRHLGAQSFTRRWTVAPGSNRSLIEDDQPADFSSYFDANGNLQCLQPGQTMTWDLRNQLSSVSPVVRENEEDDTERYIYGGGGKRLRKVRTALTRSTTVIAEVRYLPGLELHRRPTGQRYEVLDLEAGRNRVTWFHGPDAPEHPLSYQFTDHLGSVTLELDEQASVQSREAYYPFGGTAWEDHRDQTGAYKTIRYSGKTKDATGLYYYGFRYYATWLSRWINPDPAGEVDGLNLYGFVRNSPIGRVDRDGRNSEDEDEEYTGALFESPAWLRELVTPGVSVQEDAHASSSRASASHDSSVGADLTDPLLSPSGHVLEPFLSSITEELPELAVDRGDFEHSSSGEMPTASTSGSPRYACPLCSKVLSNSFNLKRHIQVHGGEKKFICETCKREFRSRSSHDRHVRTHAPRVHQLCNICGKSFLNSQSHSIHMRRHTGQGAQECPVCSKQFFHSGHLTVHIRSHNMAEHLVCNVCQKTFSQKSNLVVHMRVHSVNKPIKDSCPAPGCFSQFSSKQARNKHMKKFHGL
jgi:insecticidal toxin complex protein TccC